MQKKKKNNLLFKKLTPECTKWGVEESVSPWQVMSDQRILPLHWNPKPVKKKKKTVYTAQLCTDKKNTWPVFQITFKVRES